MGGGRTFSTSDSILSDGETMATESKQDDIITAIGNIPGGSITDTPEYFEDTNFVTGDSPAIVDINTALGRNANYVQIINDGPGDFTIEASNDGVAFGDAITIKGTDPPFAYENLDIDSVRITWVSDSAYRVIAV